MHHFCEKVFSLLKWTEDVECEVLKIEVVAGDSFQHDVDVENANNLLEELQVSCFKWKTTVHWLNLLNFLIYYTSNIWLALYENRQIVSVVFLALCSKYKIKDFVSFLFHSFVFLILFFRTSVCVNIIKICFLLSVVVVPLNSLLLESFQWNQIKKWRTRKGEMRTGFKVRSLWPTCWKNDHYLKRKNIQIRFASIPAS